MERNPIPFAVVDDGSKFMRTNGMDGVNDGAFVPFAFGHCGLNSPIEIPIKENSALADEVRRNDQTSSIAFFVSEDAEFDLTDLLFADVYSRHTDVEGN